MNRWPAAISLQTPMPEECVQTELDKRWGVATWCGQRNNEFDNSMAVAVQWTRQLNSIVESLQLKNQINWLQNVTWKLWIIEMWFLSELIVYRCDLLACSHESATSLIDSWSSIFAVSPFLWLWFAGCCCAICGHIWLLSDRNRFHDLWNQLHDGELCWFHN